MAGTLVVSGAPSAAWAAPPGQAVDDVPAEVRRALGDRVERVDRGHFRVILADGKSLVTHGPDPAVEDTVPNLGPGSPERAPACAADNHQHVLYGRPSSAANRYATVKPEIQAAVRRMNYLLHEESMASGNKPADFRVRCDGVGQIEVGQFASAATDFNNVVSAARAAGYNQARVNYTIFFDGGVGPACGTASLFDDERLVENNYNNQGGGYAVTYAGCWNGRTPMHEASHNLGAVQYWSPYSTGSGGHCRDAADVMCYSDGGDRDTGLFNRCTDKMHYDCGYDDYFDSSPEPGEYLATHWNIGSTLNRFITFGDTPASVQGWGLNQNGELGSGSTVNSSTPVPTVNMSSVRALSAGGYHGLAAKNDGTVWSWGLNNVGQLGNNSLTRRTTPVQVPGLTGVTAVAGGLAHNLALRSDGTVWAWGWNAYGQIGDGTLTDRLVPVVVPGLSGVVAVSAGVAHSLALRSDGTVWAWGLNHVGQLGIGSSDVVRTAAVVVTGLTDVRGLSAGGYHSVAVKSDGTVRAWGLNHVGQLGTGALSPSTTVPVAVPWLSGVAEVAGGLYHTLARRSGSVWSWGWNGGGQLGLGSLIDGWWPVQVAGVTGATGLAAGGYHSLVLRSDQTVLGWGWGGYGQLGAVTSLLVPGQIVTGRNVRALTSGIGHNLMIVG